MAGQTTKKDEINDDVYLKIWDIEQKHTTTRWTLMTFYLSVSFAIFGILSKTKTCQFHYLYRKLSQLLFIGLPIYCFAGSMISISFFATS